MALDRVIDHFPVAGRNPSGVQIIFAETADHLDKAGGAGCLGDRQMKALIETDSLFERRALRAFNELFQFFELLARNADCRQPYRANFQCLARC